LSLIDPIFFPFHSFLSFCSIQYVRHLHERMNVLENRTAPPKEEDTAAADAAAAAMGYGMGMGMMGHNETLMITNAPAGYGTAQLILHCTPRTHTSISYLPYVSLIFVLAGAYAPAGYGASSIPDPYSQPQGYGYGGAPGAGYGGAGYY
jgi:hypothetical protein